MISSLYRHSSIEINKKLLSLGVVRIGTLYDFRNTEHGKGIADETEGKKTLTRAIQQEDILKGKRFAIDDPDGNEMEVFICQDSIGLGYGICRGINSNFNINSATMSHGINSKDLFIYCLSSSQSVKTMALFSGANSCVEITQLSGFFTVLTEAISNIVPVTFLGYQAVAYTDREETWDGKDTGINPALIKPKSYAKQYEFRAVWKPHADIEINPMIICDHRLVQFCREVKL